MTGTVPEVVAEDDTGTLCPGVSDGGEVGLAETYRAGVPRGRPPGQGQEGTSDEEMRSILDRLAYDA